MRARGQDARWFFATLGVCWATQLLRLVLGLTTGEGGGREEGVSVSLRSTMCIRGCGPAHFTERNMLSVACLAVVRDGGVDRAFFKLHLRPHHESCVFDTLLPLAPSLGSLLHMTAGSLDRCLLSSSMVNGACRLPSATSEARVAHDMETWRGGFLQGCTRHPVPGSR